MLDEDRVAQTARYGLRAGCRSASDVPLLIIGGRRGSDETALELVHELPCRYGELQAEIGRAFRAAPLRRQVYGRPMLGSRSALLPRSEDIENMGQSWGLEPSRGRMARSGPSFVASVQKR